MVFSMAVPTGLLLYVVYLKTERFYIKIWVFSTQKYQKVWSYEICIDEVISRLSLGHVHQSTPSPTAPHHPVMLVFCLAFLFFIVLFFPQVLFNHMYFLTCICD